MEKNNLSFGPMDIDSSNQSVKDMEISANDDVVTQTYLDASVTASTSPVNCYKTYSVKEPGIKKYHINLPKQRSNTRSKCLKIIAAVLIVFISIITYHIYSLECCERLDLKNINETLSSRLYGQKAAANIIMKTLEVVANSKILIFSGGTGVGKTFTASLLLDTIDYRSNVYHYVMPSFRYTFSTDLMFGLTMCKMSLIIVDDLTIKDMDIKEQIESVILKSESLGKDIIVILIYNCYDNDKGVFNACDNLLKTKLNENFSDLKALISYITFEPLSEVHLKKCILQELRDRKLNHHDFNNIVKNFNVSVDGCKGVHSKLKYLSMV